jgi:hypothetical protein
MAYAAAFIEGKGGEELEQVQRLGQYQGTVSRLNDYVGLAGLVAAARRQYLSVSELAESLAAMQRRFEPGPEP